MKDYLYKLNDFVEKVAEEMTERLTKGGRPTEGTISYIDKVTHILKSLSCILKDEDGGSYRGSYGGSYEGGSYEGGSYDGGASGRRGRNRMGRYTSRSYGHDDYSGAVDEMIKHLEKAKECADDEEVKHKLSALIREVR